MNSIRITSVRLAAAIVATVLLPVLLLAAGVAALDPEDAAAPHTDHCPHCAHGLAPSATGAGVYAVAGGPAAHR